MKNLNMWLSGGSAVASIYDLLAGNSLLFFSMVLLSILNYLASKY